MGNVSISGNNRERIRFIFLSYNLFCLVLSAYLHISLYLKYQPQTEDTNIVTNSTGGVRTACNYQNIDDGNLDEAFAKNCDSNFALSTLKSLRLKNANKVIIAHLNINSIRQKFDQLSFIIKDNVDILVVGETKLDKTLPTAQFNIAGFSQPYRHDRNRNGGGVMIFVREELPSRQLIKHKFPNDIEALVIEINIRKTKFLLLGGYRPPSQSQIYFFGVITNALDVYTATYDKLLLAGDFNATKNETVPHDFSYKHNLICIVNNNTCFKNPCIDLFKPIFHTVFKIPWPSAQDYPIFIKW